MKPLPTCKHCNYPAIATVRIRLSAAYAALNKSRRQFEIDLCAQHLNEVKVPLFAARKARCGVQREDGAPCTLDREHLGQPHSYCGVPFEQPNRGRQ